MTHMMVGPLILLAASISPPAMSAPAAAPQPAGPQPTMSASARATVSIRIVSGVKFGSNHLGPADGAERRSAQLTDAAGAVRAAELLEFQ